ncbi:hypothetical protein CEP49_06170 [Mergibacter septicus]|uniref:hypothetical protein n=1 Tax=Mergibacter septicus TaxID=221402 RepID=UPI001178F144|nr:hypothetical protein [Mergibacter septicus]AWX14162.1 hypothetical protein CEP49_06170 [Mergibacter septicus]
MTVEQRPDGQVFASEAKSTEVEQFPDLQKGWIKAFELTQGIPPMEWFKPISHLIVYHKNKLISSSLDPFCLFLY